MILISGLNRTQLLADKLEFGFGSGRAQHPRPFDNYVPLSHLLKF